MYGRSAGCTLVVMLFLAGCFDGASEGEDDDPGPPFADAYPPRDGSLWPTDLSGPFERLPIEHVTVPAFDGVILDGWLQRPKLPEGVGAPVLINSSPYSATESDGGDDLYVEAGFAVAKFSVRGTGNSGGCLDLFGPDEQRDQATLVEWAAQQPWTNGRVGFFGGSYRGTTTLQAAVQDPAGLHAAVAVAPVADLFTIFATPEGALWNELPAQMLGAFTGIAAAPRLLGEDEVGHVQSAAERLTGGGVGRYCEDVIQALGQLQMEPAQTMRDSEFFQDRDLRGRLADVRVPLMWTDGYFDDQYWQGAHAWDWVPNAPFQYITGPWPHALPSVEGGGSFERDVMLPWFDFWLKGVGEPPAHLGKAHWQDTLEPAVYPDRGDGQWHVSISWPPPEATPRAHNLSAQTLSTTQPGTERSFIAAPVIEGTSAPLLGEGGWQWPKNFLCSEVATVAEPFRLTYVMEPSDEPWLLAGIPILDLTITSDEPGGIINAFMILYDGDGSCTDAASGPALISFGAADLLFVEDIYNATAFPVDTPTHIQLELTDIAQVVQPGQTLALVIGAGNPVDHQSRYAPSITIHASAPGLPTGLTLPVMSPA